MLCGLSRVACSLGFPGRARGIAAAHFCAAYCFAIRNSSASTGFSAHSDEAGAIAENQGRSALAAMTRPKANISALLVPSW
jgi:hypothetical protein